MTTGFTLARRLGRDEATEEFKELVNDPEASFGDIIAAAIEAAPMEHQQEVFESLRELGEDRRGPRSWARDRMERRRLGKDADARLRRMGRDDPNPFNGRPNTGGTMDPIEGEDRRRRMAGDRLALDSSSPQARFKRLFPSAIPPERA